MHLFYSSGGKEEDEGGDREEKSRGGREEAERGGFGGRRGQEAL